VEGLESGLRFSLRLGLLVHLANQQSSAISILQITFFILQSAILQNINTFKHWLNFGEAVCKYTTEGSFQKGPGYSYGSVWLKCQAIHTGPYK